MSPLGITVFSVVLTAVLGAAWYLVRVEVTKALRDLNGVGKRGRDTLYALIEAEDAQTNPELRRALFLAVLHGTYRPGEQLTHIIEGK